MSPPYGPPSLAEVASGTFAFLQRGGWGHSNAGLVSDGESALLVDTLFDLSLTRNMLEAMRRAAPAARIDTLVNTHANGDHCWGNQLVGGAEIIASRAAAEEMLELPPARMHTLVTLAERIAGLGPRSRALLGLLSRLRVPLLGPLVEAAELTAEGFGSFDFRGIHLTPPTQTFSGTLALHVGDKPVELIEVGPAHTRGDVLVYSPRDRVAFSGDIVFIDTHPILWEGPLDNWLAACERVLAMDVEVIVPGHGPLTDKVGVSRLRDYFLSLRALAEAGLAAGQSLEDLAHEALAQLAPSWGEAHRVVANLAAIHRELTGQPRRPGPVEVMALMARFERRRRRGSAHAPS